MTATATDVTNKLKVTTKLSALKAGLKPALEVSMKGALKDCKDSFKLTLEAKQNELLAYAFGGRLGVTVTLSDLNQSDLAYVCEAEGKLTINAADFQKSLDSFPEGETVVLSADGKELAISLAGDSEEVQALQFVQDEVIVPPLADEFEKEVKILRTVFLEGIKETFWGVGFEEHKEQYFYWRFIASKNDTQFATGTGGRFRFWDVEGKVTDAESKTVFYFHRDQTPAIQAVLANATGDYITLKQANRKGDTPDQIVIETDSYTVIFVGFNPQMKWPNVDKPLTEDRAYSVATKVADWEFATKGLLATFNDEFKKIHDSHESDLEANLDKGYLTLTTRSGMRSQRKVPIVAVKKQDSKTSGIEFHCSTQYVGEIFSKLPKGDVIELQYHEDPEKPVFIIGPKNPNASAGYSTQYTMFFASMKK